MHHLKVFKLYIIPILLNLNHCFNYLKIAAIIKNYGNFIVFLLYFNKKLVQFLNYCQKILIKNSHLREL